MSIAKKRKHDEFYTLLEDIEKEMVYYRPYFKNKTIFMNCDDPDWSNFWIYFSLNFRFLGIKKLIATHYEYDENASTYRMEMFHDDNGEIKTVKTPLKKNGDFRSEECIELLKESDVVITNPPFSLWREYLAQLVEYEKDYIILGNVNALTYQEVFPLFMENKVWFGPSISSGDREFRVPDDYPLDAAGYRIDEKGNKYIRVKGVRWYTNLDHKKRHEKITLTKFYQGRESEYPKYDNYDAIEVSLTKDIPMDYTGVMGVPITFMDKYSPDQFEILGMTKTPICHNNKDGARRIKIYNNAIQHNPDCSTESGNKINDGSALLLDKPPKDKIYYTADGVDGFLVAQYPRILIRNKNPISRMEILGY